MSHHYAFLEKYRDREFEKMHGIVVYNNEKTSDCGGVNWGHIGISDGDTSFIVFANSREAKSNLCESALKIHLAIESDDLEKALNIISKTEKNIISACLNV